MDINADELEVTNNEAQHQYEIHLNGETAVLTYMVSADRITLVHTGVPSPLEHHGIAGRLTQHALDDARARNQRVVPRCPYVKRYIDSHPEYNDILAS